jgi:hypothetical protein
MPTQRVAKNHDLLEPGELGAGHRSMEIRAQTGVVDILTTSIRTSQVDP